ncbi:fimbrial protein [Stenotrophomonas maltophilia]|uniref:fimbrial protein n=1 Tax=Stenotrophomonas maltophilia TaxID=40324 RepID=UPI0012FD7F4F|nr:fimbrial protein [Stenotrophomonas maltophilia]
MNKLAIALSAALSLGAAASANAADGTITFTGRIVAATCTIDYSEGTTIALGQISSGNLDSNADAGNRAFDVTLKAGASGSSATCSKDNAKLHIDTGASDLDSNGYIANTDSGGASIAVALYRTDGGSEKLLNLGSITDELDQAKSGGEFKYSFLARYKKTKTGGDFVEGDFAGKLVFDVENY